MSAPFVTQLRTRGDAIQMATPGTDTITVRVEMPEVWDVVRVVVSPSEPVLGVKVRALAALYPNGEFHDEFVMKLRGFEVLDENASLTEAGVLDGSTLLLHPRRRRPGR